MAPGDVHLTPQLIQAVRDAIDIVDIAGEATRLRRKGRRYEGLCPFHKEKTPSFGVDPDQGLFYCFGCGTGGDAIKLHQQLSGDDFPGAIEALARRYGIPLPAAPARGGRGGPRRDPSAALEAAAGFFGQQLAQSPAARRYLEQRRIPAELERRYGLGYAPDGWQHLLDALRGRLGLEDLIAAGLVGRSQKSGEPYDRFRHRLMFPIHTAAGRLVGFGGRTLGDDRAKYVNTSETEYFHKGNLLYGFHQAKRELRDGGRALLVEGYFDVIGAAAADLPWAVAGMGTALSAEQAKLLARYVDEVVVAYDSDSAGEKAFQRSLPILLAAGLGVRRARFPAGHDPDSLRLEAGPEAVREAVESARDAVGLEMERLLPPGIDSDPRAKAGAASAIGELLRPIRDDIARHGYGQRAAERLGIPLEMLWRRLGKAPEKPAASPGRLRETRSDEEKALALLMRAEAVLPPTEQLPPREVFIDPECRNIYAAFCALYRDREPVAPTGTEVVARLSNEGGAIDRAARLLLEESDSGEENLVETLANLTRRWSRLRNAELTRRIQQAQQQGDQARLNQLTEEKTNLIRSLHPGMTGRYNPE